MTMQRNASRSQEPTRFEIQSNIYHQLQQIGYQVRGGIRVGAGRGLKNIDIAVFNPKGKLIHAILMSSSIGVESETTREHRDRRYERKAKVVASLGCNVIVIDSLKAASDLIKYVRTNNEFPIMGSRKADADQRPRKIKQLERSQNNPRVRLASK